MPRPGPRGRIAPLSGARGWLSTAPAISRYSRKWAFGVTASQINNALRQLNINAAGGQAEIAGSRQSVRVLGNAGSAYELSQTQVSLGAGRSIKLADIASVRDAYGEVRSIAKLNGKQIVTFSITRARGESDVSV